MKSRIKELEQLANKLQKDIDGFRGINTGYKWELIPTTGGGIKAHWSYLSEGEHIDIMIEPVEGGEEKAVKTFDPRRGGTVFTLLVGENFWDDFKTVNEAVKSSVLHMVNSSNATY